MFKSGMENKHIWLAVGCPKNKNCASFENRNGRFICECGTDFTREAKLIYKAMCKTFATIKKQ